jgi:predicted DNA-binding transcriptional regulator AlpA
MSRRLNVDDLMALYGKPRGTIYNWIKKGALPPPIKMGRSLYWRAEEIEHTEQVNRKAPAYDD